MSVTAKSTHPTMYVAPLQLGSKAAASMNATSPRSSKTPSCHSNTTVFAHSSAQFTPPPTPQRSTDTLPLPPDSPRPDFHNFLRAFYAFHPTLDEDSETITLPLNEGDVILVHSIHTNGWADGTLLASGARGWLPTNYCVAYDDESIQNLLKALINFWDLFRGDTSIQIEVFGNQEYMRGIIAGVRLLLESSKCLTRESQAIRVHEGLRRHRKALLSELSALVRLSRKLQNSVSLGLLTEDAEYTVDEMILKAFKIVVRGVRFLDVWHHFLESGRVTEVTVPALVDSRHVPPTPPADSISFRTACSDSDNSPVLTTSDAMSPAQGGTMSPPTALARNSVEQTSQEEVTQRTSTLLARPGTALSSRMPSRPESFHAGHSAAAHRISYNGQSTALRKSDLASQRLGATHDVFLSHQGSFIGRLHLQCRSSTELLTITQRSVTACRGLLAVVDAVLKRDLHRAEALEQAKDSMYSRITDLVQTTKEVFRRSTSSDEFADIILPDESKKLMSAATTCVRAAGECVANTRFVIERIGDFELAQAELTTLDNLQSDAPAIAGDEGLSTAVSLGASNSFTSLQSESDVNRSASFAVMATSSNDLSSDSPLEAPTMSCPTASLPPQSTTASSTTSEIDTSPIKSPLSQEYYPPSPTRSIPLRVVSINQAQDGPYSHSPPDSLDEVCTGTPSQTSTRATTPDFNSPKSSLNVNESKTGSQVTLPEDCEEAEAKILEHTHAHELIYNKDGQIMGGTLPALVERLTTHDSTPDPTFVSTFYLTFRLFTTPLAFAEALINRFREVADINLIAGPVRLRVYNVFKGWLESQWNQKCDHEALPVILYFATEVLQTVLPDAGRRMEQLVERASAADGPLVPRMVPSIAKTTFSSIQKALPEIPLPTPAISKSQLAALRNWRQNGHSLSILDLDPLELARQFTIKESKIFCSILPEELLAAEWMKKTSSKAVNVRAMSKLSTNLSTLVADTILQLEDVKKRAATIKQWIKIAKKCLELNNYDSLMAIVCSLNNSTIIRLKRTWELISHKYKVVFEELRKITGVTRNYAVLRQRLQNHVPPCLPFVGTYLTDLTFVDVGNQTTRQLPGEGESRGTSVINFDKYMKTAKIIGEVQRFQIPYRLVEVPELQEWMDAQILRIQEDSEKDDVQGYYRRSLLLEPRESNTLRPSLAEAPQSSFSSATKEKFDFLGWSNHGKEKSVAAST
ncbi:MAG: hypothetical protein M1837_000873 [Sclerophora amabilis]|nr:MAG: hypothetical protein M1837_000873 [Sclerophora amabilis]